MSHTKHSRFRSTKIDGPPKKDIALHSIKDAVPKVEPYHPYGRRNYCISGRKYKVLQSAKNYNKYGYASWYGTNFHGNYTATQERYNLYEMTAASKELPLPSYVEVTNLENGKRAVLRVNDRGPFHSNRILDVSYAAAKKLGFVNEGVARVKIIGIDPRKQMYIQLGVFSKLSSAREFIRKIKNTVSVDTKRFIHHNSRLYIVQIGPISNGTERERLINLLEKNKFYDHKVIYR